MSHHDSNGATPPVSETLSAFGGEVEAILLAGRPEILRDLLAAIAAVRDHNVKLTKAGTPPKPLWSALNDRLIWADPKAVLYDWDEVDQVRFVYSLAEQLMLIGPDENDVLQPGPGATDFFLADDAARVELVLRAWMLVEEWDERCDARNETGSRHNFGQTFRRDFLVESEVLRRALVDTLRASQTGKWTLADTLAVAVTARDATLLISEDDAPPTVVAGEAESEIRRLVDYWLLLAARFGLVDLARVANTADDVAAERVYRLTSLGAWVLRREGPRPADPPVGSCLAVLPTGDVVVYRDAADLAQEYLLVRLAGSLPPPQWEAPTCTYALTPQSVRDAIQRGLAPQIVRDHLFARSRAEVPQTVLAMLEDAVRGASSMRIVRGLTAIELPPDDPDRRALLVGLGLVESGGFFLVPWSRWPDVIDAIGEIPDGYAYPTQEPLLTCTDDEIELSYLAPPLAGRDLINALGLSGETVLRVDAALLARLAGLGWTTAAVREAFQGLVGEEALPKKLLDVLR